MFNVTVECSRCGKHFSYDEILSVCTKCSGALLFKYDLSTVARRISKSDLKKREDTFWKFMELLPLHSPKNIVSLGEPYTPVLQLSKNCSLAFESVYIKDDSRLPTGTFKARGMAVAVSKLKELSIKHVTLPSAGNTAAALAAYGAKAGMRVHAFMPKDVPESILKECVLLGAKVYLVSGLIDDAAAMNKKFSSKHGWFDVSTNKQPYRFEGYKVMAFEIAEQFNWNLPDNIFFPTGGGEGVIGLWKGFKELAELRWIEKIPRLIIVQSSGCAPLVEAYRKNELEVRESWKNAETVAVGLRVPHPYASYLILHAIRETSGMAISVSDEEIIHSMKALFKEGIYACPEAASTLAALNKLGSEGLFDSSEKMLLYVTGNAMKYLDAMKIEKDKIPLLNKYLGTKTP